MAINVRILEVVEDVDPTTRQPRIRARVAELKPRTHLVNLKNCNAEQLMAVQKNVGGVLSIPAREMMMDGRFIVSVPQSDEEFFVLSPADPVVASKVVEIPSPDQKTGDKAHLHKVG